MKGKVTMMKRRRLLVVISFAALCLSAAPASANLFDFVFGNIRSDYTFSTGAFSTSVNPASTWGTVTRQEAPIEQATFSGGSWGGPEDFALSMTISNIDNGLLTADGVGEFILTDTGGDTITGNFTGQWTRILVPGAPNVFSGTMSNVMFNDDSTLDGLDGKIDGHSGSASMTFSSLPPWYGTLFELSYSGTWFGSGYDYSSDAASMHAMVVGPATPVPTAVLLGIIGLGVAGWKLRKYT